MRVITTGCVVEGFESNCRLFGSFDLLVAAHGAALANLWCAMPGAAVIEIVLYQGATMWVPLIRQLGLRYCAVAPVRNHQVNVVRRQCLAPCDAPLLLPRFPLSPTLVSQVLLGRTYTFAQHTRMPTTTPNFTSSPTIMSLDQPDQTCSMYCGLL